MSDEVEEKKKSGEKEVLEDEKRMSNYSHR